MKPNLDSGLGSSIQLGLAQGQDKEKETFLAIALAFSKNMLNISDQLAQSLIDEVLHGCSELN